MANEEIPKPDRFPAIQKTLFGIAFAFFLIYKFVLKDPEIIKNLGVGYPLFMMFWVIVMLSSAGFSGWIFADYALDILRERIKEKLKKLEDKDD